MPHRLFEINESVKDIKKGDKIGYFEHTKRTKDLYLPVNRTNSFETILTEIQSLKDSNAKISSEIEDIRYELAESKVKELTLNEKVNLVTAELEDIRCELAESKVKELVLTISQSERALEIALIQSKIKSKVNIGEEITRLDEAIQKLKNNQAI